MTRRPSSSRSSSRRTAASLPSRIRSRRLRRSLRRLFWTGAAAILVAAALIALVAVLGGTFDDTDGKILAALGSALLAGAVATTGATLHETNRSPRFGRTVAVTAPVWFAIVVWAIWDHFSGNLAKAAVTAYVVLAAELAVTTARALVGSRRQPVLFGATAACVAVATAITLAATWLSDWNDATAKAAGAFWILGVLGYLLIPVARRVSGPPAAAPRRLEAGEGITRVKLDGTLYVVLEGRARFGGLELTAGEAAISAAAPQLDRGARILAVS